jgi:O-antigen/teichoic acid export membrane protein
MISKGFLKSSIVYTLGGAMPMVASITLLPFYTNYLNELNFLQVAFYISISLLFQILFTFSLDTYFGVKYTQLHTNPEKQKRFIGTTAILLLLLGVFWLSVTALSGNYLIGLIFRADYQFNFWPYGFYAILTAFFNAYFKTSTNCLIYLKQPVLFLTLNFINLVATLAISIGGLWLFPDSIVGPMYGRLLSGLIIFALAQYVFTKFGSFKFDKEFLPDLKKFCVPFLFYVLSGWVLSQIDRFMLQSYIEKADLNTYDLVLKCFFGIEFLQNSLSAVIFPKLYEIWSKQDKLSTTKESNRYFNVFTVVNIMQLIVFCIAVPLLYKLVITKASFYDAASYIGILAAGYGLRSILNFYLSTILFTKNTFTLLKIFGISALFQIMATYYAALHFGLLGVIYAGIITKVLQVILSALFTRNIFKYQFNVLKIYIVPVLFLVVNVSQYYLSPVYRVELYMLQLVVFSILFFFLFKKEIKQVLIQFNVIRS